MSGNQSGWSAFDRLARIPDPDQVAAADKVKSQWAVSAQGSYSPDDVFYETQDRHHHSGQVNVKFPQHWEPMMQEFIAKSPRYRSLQDFIRTSIIHQMVYEGMRDVMLAGNSAIAPSILVSEIMDNATLAVTAEYDAWERRIKLFEKMCERLIQAGDADRLAHELNKYDSDVKDTDIPTYFHGLFQAAFTKFSRILQVMLYDKAS